MISPIRETEKKYSSRAMITAIMAGFLFILAGYKPVGKGLVLGTIFSAVNFVLIGETLPSRIGKSKKKTFFAALGSIFFRYVLMAIPLVVAIKYEQFNLFAVIVGIFSVQLMILFDQLANYIETRKN